MKTAINDYLLQNYPKIWKSKLHWSLIFTFLFSIIFFLFADKFDTEVSKNGYEDEGNDGFVFGTIPIIIWSGIVIFWLYLQTKNGLALNKFSLCRNFYN